MLQYSMIKTPGVGKCKFLLVTKLETEDANLT
jgi:hypothetical protein